MPRARSLVSQHKASEQSEELRGMIAESTERDRAAYLCQSEPQVARFFIDLCIRYLNDCSDSDSQIRAEHAWRCILTDVRGHNVALQYNVDDFPHDWIQQIRLVEIYELCVCVTRIVENTQPA